MNLPATAAQTVGPFFRIGLEPLYVNDLAPRVPASGKIAIQGRVLDGERKAVDDAVLKPVANCRPVSAAIQRD